jgi:hypothetical protein
MSGGTESRTPGKQSLKELSFVCWSFTVLQLRLLGTDIMLTLQRHAPFQAAFALTGDHPAGIPLIDELLQMCSNPGLESLAQAHG